MLDWDVWFDSGDGGDVVDCEDDDDYDDDAWVFEELLLLIYGFDMDGVVDEETTTWVSCDVLD